MSTQEIVVQQPAPLAQPMSAAEMRNRVNQIQQVMQAVMKEDTHYGVIPGTNKPTLYKAGSEVLLSTFRIAVEPQIEDLSTKDEARFRITARLTTHSGIFLGSGVGEASSDEEKYKWRAAVCDEEFDGTDEDRRRVKFGKSQGGFYTVKQVRASVADVRNTILKMAKKRAQIDATLTVLGASDIFTQDVEDMPAEYVGQVEPEATRPVVQPTQKAGPQKVEPQPEPKTESVVPLISEKQGKRLYAIYKSVGLSDDAVRAFLRTKYNVEHSRDIPLSKYEEICDKLSKKEIA